MRRVVAALALLLGVLGTAAGAAATVPGVPVLMYHRVDPVTPADAVGRDLTLAPAAFEAQLAWLRDHHIRTITTAQLVAALARGEHPRDAVVLTFDDGYTDAATVVTPLLQKYGDVASFYVSAGFIGDGRHASWRQLRAMRDAGMEIGCHGSFHLDLSTLGRSAAEREIGGCERALGRYLGRPLTYAYAAGKTSPTARSLLRADGFLAALTERPGTVASLADSYLLPRRRIDRDDGLAAFASLATP